jgi:hypothetical protein
VAATITEQSDLLAAWLVLPAELERLTTSEMYSNNWLDLHTAAWSAVKKDLLKRRDPIEEDDITDTDELIDAVLYYVMHIAYRVSEVETDQIEAKKWYRRYTKEMNELQITVSGSAKTRNNARTVLQRG